MATYAEQIAQWRVQRAQQQIADRTEQIVAEHAQVARERDIAIANGDMDEAEMRDRDAEQLEAEYAQYNPPRQQIDPRLAQFGQQNRAFLERHGVAGYQALDAAHQYMMRPRRNDTNNPAYTGMGWNPKAVFTPQYFERLKDLLEMHGEQYFGVKYDRAEESLTPNEAAKISGLSADAYNNAARRVYGRRR